VRSGLPVEGVDYIELKPPQAVESLWGRIEVLRVYGFYLSTKPERARMLRSGARPRAWAEGLPRDGAVQAYPGNSERRLGNRCPDFLHAGAIGELERLHRHLFDTIHQQGGVRLRAMPSPNGSRTGSRSRTWTWPNTTPLSARSRRKQAAPWRRRWAAPTDWTEYPTLGRAGPLPRRREHIAQGDARQRRLSHRRNPQATRESKTLACRRLRWSE